MGYAADAQKRASYGSKRQTSTRGSADTASADYPGGLSSMGQRRACLIVRQEKALASLHGRHTCVRLLTRFEPSRLLEKMCSIFSMNFVASRRQTFDPLACIRRRRSPGRIDDHVPSGAGGPAVQKLWAAAYFYLATWGSGRRKFVPVFGGG